MKSTQLLAENAFFLCVCFACQCSFFVFFFLSIIQGMTGGLGPHQSFLVLHQRLRAGMPCVHGVGEHYIVKSSAC